MYSYERFHNMEHLEGVLVSTDFSYSMNFYFYFNNIFQDSIKYIKITLKNV